MRGVDEEEVVFSFSVITYQFGDFESELKTVN